MSFLNNRKYLPALEQTRAGAVIVHPDLAARVPATAVPLVTDEPYAAWARVAALFHPLPPLVPGVHPSAVVAADAAIDPSAEIGPLAVIGAGVEIGPRCRIGAPGGDGPRRGARPGLPHRLPRQPLPCACSAPGSTSIRARGSARKASASPSRRRASAPCRSLAGSSWRTTSRSAPTRTIDRGSLQDTVIGAGSRLDNLVQIGHNVHLGRGCVVVAQVGISGSTILEDHVMLGGQAGLTGHLRIGRRARIGAQAGVMADVPAGADVVGSPAQPVRALVSRGRHQFAGWCATARSGPPRRGARRGRSRKRSRRRIRTERDGRDHTARGWHRRGRAAGHRRRDRAGRYRPHHARDPASLPVSADRPGGGPGAERLGDRHQERVGQRSRSSPGIFPTIR